MVPSNLRDEDRHQKATVNLSSSFNGHFRNLNWRYLPFPGIPIDSLPENVGHRKYHGIIRKTWDAASLEACQFLF
jgi:hypothetical protein